MTECSSTPLVSENEKGEATINVEDPGSISDVVWDEYQVRKQQILLKKIINISILTINIFCLCWWCLLKSITHKNVTKYGLVEGMSESMW